jgi:hypothetical protein
MKDIKTVALVDAVAAIYASDEHQANLVKIIDPKFSREGRKPSANMWITHADDAGETTSTNVPSVADFAKVTLDLGNKWTDTKAVAVKVTDKHRDLAEEAIAAIGNNVMMQVLQGKTVNGFIGNMAKLVEGETVTSRDMGLLSYVPKTAKQIMENSKVDEVKSSFVSTSKALGTQGVKVFATVTIFNSRNMTQYESVLYEGHDDAGNLITFFKNESAKDQFKVGETYSIHGKVKSVGETAYSYGANVNTLNYVRKVK